MGELVATCHQCGEEFAPGASRFTCTCHPLAGIHCASCRGRLHTKAEEWAR